MVKLCLSWQRGSRDSHISSGTGLSLGVKSSVLPNRASFLITHSHLPVRFGCPYPKSHHGRRWRHMGAVCQYSSFKKQNCSANIVPCVLIIISKVEKQIIPWLGCFTHKRTTLQFLEKSLFKKSKIDWCSTEVYPWNCVAPKVFLLLLSIVADCSSPGLFIGEFQLPSGLLVVYPSLGTTILCMVWHSNSAPGAWVPHNCY